MAGSLAWVGIPKRRMLGIEESTDHAGGLLRLYQLLPRVPSGAPAKCRDAWLALRWATIRTTGKFQALTATRIFPGTHGMHTL